MSVHSTDKDKVKNTIMYCRVPLMQVVTFHSGEEEVRTGGGISIVDNNQLSCRASELCR